MSSQIYRSASRNAKSLLFYASKQSSCSLQRKNSYCGCNSFLKRHITISSFVQQIHKHHRQMACRSTCASCYSVHAYQEAHAAQMERTFIAIKPDGVQRGLISEIIEQFERKDFKLVAMKLVVPSKYLVQKHYHNLKERPYFNDLCNYLSSGPVLAMVWEGEGAIAYGHKLIQATDPRQSQPGTIGGDVTIAVGRNIMHGSDGLESAKNEIDLWFSSSELTNYTSNLEKWIYGINP